MGHALFTAMKRMKRQTGQANCKCTAALGMCETAGARFSRLWGGKVSEGEPSQRSLHNAPIFRLLLKVAVKGTHQCDLSNFCGGFWPPTLEPKKRCGLQLLPRCLRSLSVCWGRVVPMLFASVRALAASVRPQMLPRRVCCAWQSARPVQHARASEQARENTAPKKNKCDKQVSSWRHISCHTDKNRYYT